MRSVNKHPGLCQRVIAAALAVCALTPAALRGQDAPSPGTQTEGGDVTFEARFAATAGAGERNVEVPTQAGPRKLDTSVFPTVGLVLSGDYRVLERLSIGLLAQYETSVGLHATDTRNASATDGPALRSHYGDFGATAAYYFGSSPRSSSFRLLIGWEIRGLQSTVELNVPSYTLHGAIIRPEFELRLWSGRISLGIAPELLVVVGVSEDVRSLGSTASGGIGLGGQARAIAKLGDAFELGIAYRASYVLIASAHPGDMQDLAQGGLALVGLHY